MLQVLLATIKGKENLFFWNTFLPLVSQFPLIILLSLLVAYMWFEFPVLSHETFVVWKLC